MVKTEEALWLRLHLAIVYHSKPIEWIRPTYSFHCTQARFTFEYLYSTIPESGSQFGEKSTPRITMSAKMKTWERGINEGEGWVVFKCTPRSYAVLLLIFSCVLRILRNNIWFFCRIAQLKMKIAPTTWDLNCSSRSPPPRICPASDWVWKIQL